jgi:ElaB/YqjD/DUF883 family membrane-anchored ribosome-binding protein
MKATVSANGGNIQHTMERGADKATEAAHNAIDTATDAAHPAVDDIATKAHGAVDRAGVAATYAAGTLGVKGDQLNDQGKRIIERASGYVRENPLASLGIVVATGYVLSRLLSSR